MYMCLVAFPKEKMGTERAQTYLSPWAIDVTLCNFEHRNSVLTLYLR